VQQWGLARGTGDPDVFLTAGMSGDDLDARFGDPERFGQNLDAGLVGFALDRRRGELQFQGIAVKPQNLVARGSRLDMNLEREAC